MKIEYATIFLLRLPLLQQYKHHGISRSYTDNIVLRLRSDDLEGYGEGVPRIYVTGESARSAFEALQAAIVPSLVGTEFRDIEAVKAFLLETAGGPLGQGNLAAFCAFELALLDLSSKYWHHPLECVFETSWHAPPPYSAVIPILPSDRLDLFLNLLRKHDMRSVKIKVGVDVDPRVFEGAVTVLGPDVDLRVDANGAWTAGRALKNIDILKTYAVQAVEQPVAKDDLDGLRTVTHHADMVVIADESVCSLEDAGKLMSRRACDAFNIRLSKCGGFFGSLAVVELARRGGLRCQVGCQVGETGILSAAGRHLAGWLENLLYLEGSFGTWILQEDIVEEDIRFGRGGQALPLEGPGLGVHVCQEKLRKFSILSETLEL